MLCIITKDKFLTWVPSIPLTTYLELLEIDVLNVPPDFPLIIIPSVLVEELSFTPEDKLLLSVAVDPKDVELPTARSGIKGRIDSATIEFRHGSSSMCTIFVECTVEGTFFGLELNVQMLILVYKNETLICPSTNNNSRK